MSSLLSFVANTLSAGVGAVVGLHTTLRATQNLQPHPLPHQFAALLDHRSRLSYLNPGEILGMYGVDAGMTVLDLGCGTGLFTVEAARMVGDQGIVHAVDIQVSLLNKTGPRLHGAGVFERVKLHHCGAYDLPLPDDSVDLAILVSTLGEIPDKPAALSELRRVLKAGGRLGVSEELLHPAYMLPGSVRRWAEEAGFRFGAKTGSPVCYHVGVL